MRLAVRNLDFGYPAKRVGSGINFALESGEVLCLLGPNGSGKTTLFKTILGLLPAQGGEIRLGDDRLVDLSRREVARCAALVPQAHLGYFPFTVFDVVLMGRAAHVGPFSAPGRRDRATAHEAMATLGIERLADAIYTRISGGERQLVLIARALAQQSQLMIMDEPTANLDFGNQVLVLEQVSALARAGLSVVISTHDPDHAFMVADRVALLHRGALLHIGSPAETITPEIMKIVYGADVEVLELTVAGRKRRVCLPALRSGVAALGAHGLP